ncbi:MAG: thioredoxin [Acidobacteria bacterium]|nr:thioredoxin [Acidobacteriota bacterium]
MSSRKQILVCRECGAKNRVLIGQQLSPVCGKCKSVIKFPDTPVTITDPTFSLLVEKSELPVLLDLWAAWCGPCRMVAPIIDEIAKNVSGKAIVGKLDVDKNQTTARRLNVMSIPTIIIFSGGREAERLIGLQTKEAILKRLEKYLT